MSPDDSLGRSPMRREPRKLLNLNDNGLGATVLDIVPLAGKVTLNSPHEEGVSLVELLISPEGSPVATLACSKSRQVPCN